MSSPGKHGQISLAACRGNKVESIIAAFVDGLNVFKGHPVIISILTMLILALMYTTLALKWPQILPDFSKKDKPTDENGKENKDKSAEELKKLDWKAKKALQDQLWKQTLSDGINAVLKENLKELSVRVKALEDSWQNDSKKRKTRQVELDKQLVTLELQLCICIIYTPGVSFEYKMRYAIKYFKLHGNGSVREDVVAIILKTPDGRKRWHGELNEDIKNNGICEDAFFKNTTHWIEQQLGTSFGKYE